MVLARLPRLSLCWNRDRIRVGEASIRSNIVRILRGCWMLDKTDDAEQCTVNQVYTRHIGKHMLALVTQLSSHRVLPQFDTEKGSFVPGMVWFTTFHQPRVLGLVTPSMLDAWPVPRAIGKQRVTEDDSHGPITLYVKAISLTLRSISRRRTKIWHQ